MDEYISKEAMLKKLNAVMEHYSSECNSRTVLDVLRFIKYVEDFPAADVQPVNQWISVKDKLPETNAIGIAHILVYDKWKGVVKADFLDESANYKYGSNIFQISNTSTQLYKVTHWKPLPEPPKDGDEECQ